MLVWSSSAEAISWTCSRSRSYAGFHVELAELQAQHEQVEPLGCLVARPLTAVGSPARLLPISSTVSGVSRVPVGEVDVVLDHAPLAGVPGSCPGSCRLPGGAAGGRSPSAARPRSAYRRRQSSGGRCSCG